MNRKFGGILWATVMAVLGAEAAMAEVIFIKCTTEHFYDSRKEARTLQGALLLPDNMKEFAPVHINWPTFWKIEVEKRKWMEFNDGSRSYDWDFHCGGISDFGGFVTSCRFENKLFSFYKKSQFNDKHTITYSINRIDGTFKYDDYNEIYVDPIQFNPNEPKEKDRWVVYREQRTGRCEPSEDMEKRVKETRKF